MPRKPTPPLSLTRAVQIFQMLGDGTRLRILILLDQKGKLTVTQLREALEQSQPATSHHLALLRRTGLVQYRRDGKNNFYFLASEQVRQWIRAIKFGAGRSSWRGTYRALASRAQRKAVSSSLVSW